MGMFDSVYAACPSCGAQVEFQSKVGPCELKRYRATSVPAVIAIALAGESRTCRCGTNVRLDCEQLPDRVRMDVGSVSAGDDEEWD